MPQEPSLVPSESSKPKGDRDQCRHHDFSDPSQDPDQETLELHQARLLFRSQAFLDAADPILVEDLQSCVIDMNKAAEAAYGWTREELLGHPIKTLIPENRHQDQGRGLRTRCLAGELVRDVEGVRRTRNGERIPVLLTLSVARNESGEPAAIVSVAKDQRGTRRLQRQRASAQRAAQHAEEQERRALANDLHDALGQLLALSRMQLARLRSGLEQPDALKQVGELEGLLGQMDEQVRTLQFRLSPQSLYDLGLTAAAEQLAEDMERGFGLEVEVRHHGGTGETDPWPPLSDEVATVVFRCLRELLINVARHSEANRALVRIVCDAGNPRLVHVEVQDGGKGFDPEQASSGSFGLMSVRERLESVGGGLEIESVPGGGTLVRMAVPLRNGSAGETGPEAT